MKLGRYLIFAERYNPDNFESNPSKEDILTHMGELFYEEIRKEYPRKYIPSSEIIANALIEREGLVTTGVGQGIALPTSKIEGLSKIYMGAYIFEDFDWDAIDKQPVVLAMPIIAPKSDDMSSHLNVMARISNLLKKGPMSNSRERIDKIIDFSKNEFSLENLACELDFPQD